MGCTNNRDSSPRDLYIKTLVLCSGPSSLSITHSQVRQTKAAAATTAVLCRCSLQITREIVEGAFSFQRKLTVLRFLTTLTKFYRLFTPCWHWWGVSFTIIRGHSTTTWTNFDQIWKPTTLAWQSTYHLHLSMWTIVHLPPKIPILFHFDQHGVCLNLQ